MSIDSFVGSLSQDEKLRVMELIWEDLIRRTPQYASPFWHADVLAERLANPSTLPRLGVDAAKTEIMERLNARRTES
jgi:hypothetical protein